MLIEIDNDVAMPEIETRTVVRKPRVVKLPSAVKRVVEAYKEAYKLVYGVTPEVTFRDGYLRIKGSDTGVTRNRLKEMTTQLKWRHG